MGITIGFWVFVYNPADYAPLEVRRKRPACDDSLRLTMNCFWTTDWTNHGPLLVFFSKCVRAWERSERKGRARRQRRTSSQRQRRPSLAQAKRAGRANATDLLL
jgi:hypothetical protein